MLSLLLLSKFSTSKIYDLFRDAKWPIQSSTKASTLNDPSTPAAPNPPPTLP